MNKTLFSLTLLAVIATTIPACRNRKKETSEEINTMIELDSIVAEKEEPADAKIIKF